MGRQLNQSIKFGTLFLIIAAALVVALPVMALVAFSLRFAVLAVAIAALVAVAVSPTFRAWITSEQEAATSYLGLRMPTDELLFAQHTWARVESDGRVAVGADDLAQKILGPVDGIELPAVGTTVRQGDVLLRLRHGARTLTLRSPVSGIIKAVNERLASEPTLVNDAPYGLGFAAMVEPRYLAAARKSLRKGGAARVWMRAEIDRMMAALTPSTPVYALQDGGHLVDNVHETVSDAAWASIKDDFFGDRQA
jgi:glycine cleavage system H protein